MASDSEGDDLAHVGMGEVAETQSQMKIPVCTCDNCPMVESYEECCKTEVKSSLMCQGNNLGIMEKWFQ